VVDFGKLAKQTDIATKVTEDLVAGPAPTFVGNAPLATYADALELQSVVTQSLPDINRFTPTQQTQLQQFVTDLNGVVSRGEAQFNSNDVSTLLGGAANAVNILTTGTCDGFLAP
jgi:hypothetical protein